MTSEPEEFVDPALRSVIRRAQAGHTAPPDLRRRVADRLAQAMQEMDKQAAGSSAILCDRPTHDVNALSAPRSVRLYKPDRCHSFH